MRFPLTLCAIVALVSTSARAEERAAPPQARAPAQQVPQAKPDSGPAGIERHLLGTWYGPSCGGDYTFAADGTYVVRMFTPGQNTLTGTWAVRWDALPPTLVLTCKTSDFRTNDPTRPEWEGLGKAQELKLIELSAGALAWQFKADGVSHFSRRAEQGGGVTRE